MANFKDKCNSVMLGKETGMKLGKLAGERIGILVG